MPNYINDYGKYFKLPNTDNSNPIMEATKQLYLSNFNQSLFVETAFIEDVSYEVLIRHGKKNEEKKAIFKPDTHIDVGSVLEFNNKKYLVLDFLGEGVYQAYPTATIKLCNSAFHVLSNRTRKLIGHDSDGRPIYDDQYEVDYYEPCVVENKVITTQDRGQILLPEGQLNITIKYIKADNIKLGSEFQMYDEVYEIRDIDYSKAVNEIGIITLNGRRKTG
ncbi:hypothetical protein [Robertmurraya siralis]|uniref:hypothetical protein n=1 Tax=Robertmurraya siralis TaxID=77777 RepID=UPI0010F9A4CC|nr:hypothetical protein [Robertmurraya siralis]